MLSHVGLCWLQNARVIRIDYWVEKAETGIHFKDNVLHTDNQIRRARCWFPCIDDSSQRCWYEWFGYMTDSVCACFPWQFFPIAMSQFILFIIVAFMIHAQL